MTTSKQVALDAQRDVTQLQPHRSRLPTFFYLLSFAPPCPPIWKDPRGFFTHPIVLYVVGFVTACAAGVSMPSLDLLYGYWTNGITPGSSTSSGILARSSQVAWIMTVIGAVSLALNCVYARQNTLSSTSADPLHVLPAHAVLFLTCFASASHNLTVRLRHTYVASIIVQDQAFFDVVGPGEIASRASKDISTIRTALGEKMAFIVWALATLLTGLISAFINAPRLAGVLFALIPFTVIVFALLGWATDLVSTPALALEGRAASLVEQTISSVRIVQAFGMAQHLIRRLNQDMLERLERLGLGRSLIRGVEQSTIYTILNLSYSTSFWFGSIQIARGDASIGAVLTTFFNILNALFALANAVPHLAILFEGYVALGSLRKQIERVPAIDVRNQGGSKQPGNLDKATPAFELRNINFAYPSRPFTKSLDDVSARIERGQVTAFVGPSGSGKTTIASLLMREYDPETCNWRNPVDPLPEAEQREAEEAAKANKAKKGRLPFLTHEKSDSSDGTPSEKAAPTDIEAKRSRVTGSGLVSYQGQDLRSYNLRWLRSQVAVVSQHPQLFTASILDNVAAGLREDAVVEDKRALCIEALKKADAWHFVEKLPQGIDTVVSGGRVGLLSGGQRQRVAIARALVREPEVLILDEGTSALDSATEDRIKVMLQEEQRRRGMTLVLIAHRLSTIREADKIIVMAKGEVRDQGTYDELMSAEREDQTFREMAVAQQAAQEMPVVEPSSRRRNSLSTLATSTAIDGRTAAGGGSDGRGNRRGTLDTPTPPPPASHALRRLSSAYSGRGGGHPEHSAASAAAAAAAAATTAGPTNAQDAAGISHVLSAKDEDTAREENELGEDTASSPRVRLRWRSLFATLSHRKWFFLIGILGAIIGGGSFPVAGYLTGRAVDALSIEGNNAELRRQSNDWALYFFILALADLVIFLVNAFFLELASESVVRKLKVDGLRALLRQEIGFFDQEDSASGALTSAVSSHPSNVGAATGLILSQVILSLTNLLGSLILGLVLSWKATLVCLAPVFVLFVAGFAEVAALERYETMASKPSGKAAAYISEIMDGVRTVSALGRESEVIEKFDDESRSDPHRYKFLALGALGFATGQAMVLFLSALVFYWGGKLLSQDDLGISQLYAVFEAVIIGAFSAGRLFTYIGDYSRAYSSFGQIQAWLSRKPRVASIAEQQGEPKEAGASATRGDIVFSRVEMRYPQRPSHAALRCLDLTIQSGSNVAFCGTSGSGKSSLLALIERFYDPRRGTITFGGIDSRSMSIDELRAGIAYVSQDPVLFEGSLRWNIALGANDPLAVTDEAIESALEQACILDFVRTLPSGLDTDIGMKGAQLSGGQKQRLCIARAILRDAPLLLLDEATSALDATSEKSVQRALDRASVGRTTVTIAHRLSTIRKADVIHVVEDGSIVESGSHDELLARGGRYRDLVAAQL